MLLGPPTALSMAWSSEMTSLCVCETDRDGEIDFEMDLYIMHYVNSVKPSLSQYKEH